MNVLRIDMWSSTCMSCGKGCDPNEKTHKTVLGYGAHHHAGCGVTYTHVTSGYPLLSERVQKMRPDLVFIEP